MHAERTADPADLDEDVDEVRAGGQQLGELVDHHEQRRHLGQRRAGRAGLLVVPQRGEVPGRTQELLAADQLAVDGVGHAVDQRQLVDQVGDHGAGVRQPVQPGERGAALEVDEREVQRVRRVRDGEREHEGAQQLALAGAGGADQQAVRAHAVLRGLLEVELDRRAVRADAELHPQPVPVRPWHPGVVRVERVRVAEVEQFLEPQLGASAAARRVAPSVSRSGASWRASASATRPSAACRRGRGRSRRRRSRW